MNSLFSYESKFMQLMLTVADYIILNVIYILCCIPIFTMGAAQAGLYSGLRVLQDKEDDTSCVRAFFKGFSAGFKTITLVWCISALVLFFLANNILSTYIFDNANYAGAGLPYWMSIIATCLAIIFQTMIPLFHSKFGCTAKQLVRNTFYVVMANPIQSIILAVALWAPVILAMVQYAVFLQISLIFLFMYYSIAMGFAMRLMNKSFARLTEQFNESNT